MIELIPIFPTALGVVDLPRELTEQELLFFKKQETVYNQGNLTSKNNYILENPELADLKYLLYYKAQEYFHRTVAPRYNNQIRITQSWINYNGKGQFHHKHSHPNSIVSGVYYIQSDENTGKIHFYNEYYKQIRFESDHLNEYNSISYNIAAKKNRLVLFPSSLTHEVEELNSVIPRLSLAFNTFITGMVGEDNTLTGLRL